jgi:uncharacterized protein (DUF488 family)
MPEAMFTIGYQGASLEHLIQTLAAAEVEVLLDTRETPMSRRPEFRGPVLASALSAAGIRYVSVRALGAPKALRALAPSDWARFAEGYRDRLRLVREELERILPIIDGERVCLFCFEADPGACHRSLLAHEIERLLDVEAVHLDARRVDQADDHEGALVRRQAADDEVQVARFG